MHHMTALFYINMTKMVITLKIQQTMKQVTEVKMNI